MTLAYLTNRKTGVVYVYESVSFCIVRTYFGCSWSGCFKPQLRYWPPQVTGGD